LTASFGSVKQRMLAPPVAMRVASAITFCGSL
jgi:hypothetical protein